MNSVGQSGDKKSYRVILLLVVGLATFSSAMKELNQIREFTREASNLAASWSSAIAPVEPAGKVTPIEVPRTAVRLEVCDSAPMVSPVEPVELPPAVASVAREQKVETKVETMVEIREAEKPLVAARSLRREQVTTLRKPHHSDIDIVELRKQARRAADVKVIIMADGDEEAEISIPTGLHLNLPKVKSLREFRISQQEHDVLKSLNRSINLRSAG